MIFSNQSDEPEITKTFSTAYQKLLYYQRIYQ